MSKWPKKIRKTKFTIPGLSGDMWVDRWEENIWFFAKQNGRYKLFTPIEVNRIIDNLDFYHKCYINMKLIYNEPIKDLLSSRNPLLELIPKTDSLYSQPVILRLE